MLKSLLWVAAGAAGALQADRWLRQKRARLSPNAVAGSFLDRVNDRLEAGRAPSATRRVDERAPHVPAGPGEPLV